MSVFSSGLSHSVGLLGVGGFAMQFKPFASHTKALGAITLRFSRKMGPVRLS